MTKNRHNQYLWLAITGPLWRYNNSRSAQVHWLSSYRSWMGFRTGVEAVEFTGVAARIVNLKEKNPSDEKLQCYATLKFFAHWALDTYTTIIPSMYCLLCFFSLYKILIFFFSFWRLHRITFEKESIKWKMNEHSSRVLELYRAF